ncbi:glycerophosphodiester phosphodiesterase [Pusillimonas sp.]|uniref:glycerophosphodiester phosphodiesterase n=1 Tax=Pusillimonas sp. TaxID=3040095 RepID=UPI0037C6F67B
MQLYAHIIAHRGAGRLAPENTLAAMRVAARHKLSMVEYDVTLSRDEIPIVLHDRNIRRTSNGEGNADELTLAELARFDFGGWHGPEYAGEPLATLYSIAAFTLANQIRSNIEIKPQPGRETLTGKVVARAAAELWGDAARPPLLSSFSEAALLSARQTAPQLPRALLLEGPLPGDWHKRAARLGCVALHLQQEHIDRHAILAVHGKGYKIAAWTVNDAQRAQDLLQWGCDALFTDAVDTLPPALQTI